MAEINTPTPAMNELLRRSGDANFEVAIAAQHQLAKALELPLLSAVLNGSIVDMFGVENLAPDAAPEYPLDFLNPGEEKLFTAYTIPNQGRIPEKHISGDYVMVPTYDVGGSIDWLLKYARNVRWPMVDRAMKVLETQFVRKDNSDAWHTILAAAVGRNLVVSDTAAPAGLFSKRLVVLADTIMRRNAGGNSTSVNRGRMTDIYMSPEGLGDIRSWDLTQIDDVTRREIFVAGDGDVSLTRIFGKILHDIDEFGVGQEFDNYYANTLAGTKPNSNLEVAIALDLINNDSFVNPVKEKLAIFPDPALHRSRKAGFYGWKEQGWSVLDSRRTLAIVF